MILRCFAALLLVVVTSTLSHGGTSAKRITAHRIDQPPVIDGRLDDQVWRTASPASDFRQFDPEEGAAPTESTAVYILYDNDALYVGVMCFDSNPQGIVGQLTRRDRGTEADRFSIQIDSYHDHQTAFVFQANVTGVQGDGVLSRDGLAYDNTRDAVWRVETAIGTDGWSAEFVIPFNAIRFTHAAEDEYEWGINFRRYISRKRETAEWIMVPRSETVQISRWGHLEGIRNITPPHHLTVIPYVSGRGMVSGAGSPHPSRTDIDGTGGVDVEYGVTRNFTIDATINPDFGQVEVDQAVLNLTVFETLFPEKRPFFVEGSQIFVFGGSVDNTSLPLFFSRRVGRRPRGSFSVQTPSGGSIEENPLQTTILGAAKISGRTGSGLSLGAVAALTDEEEAILKDQTGATSSVLTEPRGSYNVLRLKQEFDDNSWVGAMGTAVSRDRTNPSFSGGIDWNVRLPGGDYTIDGYLVRSVASRTPERVGTAGRILFSRLSSEHWFFTTSYDFASRMFDINDMGFFARPHDHGGYVQILYRENFAPGIFRRYSLAVNPEYRWNWDGIRTTAVLHSSLTGEFRNFWVATVAHEFAPGSHEDAERGIIGIYRRPSSHTVSMALQSDERKDLSAGLSANFEKDAFRKQRFSGLLAVKIRPAPWVELSPFVYYERTRNAFAGVFSGGRVVSFAFDGVLYSLFAERDLDEVDVGLRGTVTFTRSLSLQCFSQVLLARGKHDNFSLVTGSREFTRVTVPDSYDFNLVSFNANILLRWEYLPGSTLYLVWTQSRFGDSGSYATGFGTRFRETFTLPHDDVFVLKASYWFSL